MIELYGNKIWNSNTPNKYKKVIIANEDSFDNICQELENSGLNYCAYIFNGEAHIAIGRATATNIDKLDIDYQTVIECNSKVYKTNNIIGTTTYDSIEDKLYRKYNTDFAYKIGQRLTEQGILFSGRIYGKTTTITVDEQYADTLNKISAELKEQRASFMSKSEIVQNESPEELKSVDEKISELHFNESQLSALAPSVKFIQTRNDDNLTDNFVSLFSDCTDFYESQLSALAEIYVDTYQSFSDKSLMFADTSRFNDLKQRFVNDNITAKLTENRGYSTTQLEIIREMVTYGMSESVINLLDYTFSTDEMQNYFSAYKNGSYEDLINIIAEIKGTTRTDIEGQIEGGTYTPALPDFNTLEKTLYFQESEVESITYMYYNPDAYSGGQFVITEVSYKQIAEANKEYGDDFSGFFDFLDTTGEQRLIDIGSESFRTAVKKFYSGTEFAEGLNADIQHKLVELAVVPEIKLPEVRKIELIKDGDFYEVRGENAKTVADILDLVSTTRNINGSSVDTVGFPDFKLNDNTELLKTQGFTVNIKYEELAPFYEEHDELDDIDPAVIRQQLEDAGIVNGELVDEDKLNSDPFIQQVMAVAESDAGALNVSSEEIVNQFNSENEIVPINEPERTESVQKIIRPTITCDWSESPVFENGKTYSVSEFDKLMKNADDEWVEQRQLEIEEYGSENAVAEAYRNGELDNIHLGYEKTKFIINMPNGTKHTERQDIGDGIGGVIDFLEQYPQYSDVVKLLKDDIAFENRSNELLKPLLAFDEQVAIVNEFFDYEKAWHNVDDGISEIAEKYRNGDNIDVELAKHFINHYTNLNSAEITDDYEIQITSDGVSIQNSQFFQAYNWDTLGTHYFKYLYDTFNSIKEEQAAEYPEKESAAEEINNNTELHSVDELAMQLENDEKSTSEKSSVGKNNFMWATSGDTDEHAQTTSQPTLFDSIPVSDVSSDEITSHENYVLEDRESVTGAKTKFRNNITAIKILKQIETENRTATPEEQKQLSLYSGWGGLANAFASDNDKWENEYSELKELLTADEYTAARSSVLDAFFTDSVIIDSIYNVVQNAGFKGGNILEPAMGIGNFFGRLPSDLRENSKLYGVEKDSLSGRIAKKLYPQADITIDGFENTRFNDNSFDVAIGNIPFGDFSVNDSKYNSEHLKIHDYFFLKSLDKVRDGGIVAFVTSKGTLDKKDSSFRKTLAERADLVGAIRLPNNAFKSAGTEVTPDIIFLQKRSAPLENIPSWVNVGTTENGLSINNYFIEHPEMVLGDIVQGNKLYGRTDDTMCVPFADGRPLSELLPEAVKNIVFTYSPAKEVISPVSKTEAVISKPEGLRSQSYYKSGNEIYFYGSNSAGELVTVSAKDLLDKKYTTKNIDRLTAFMEIRDTLRELLEVQQHDNNDAEVEQLQHRLNTIYDNFYDKYGLIHSRYNRNILGFDGAYQLVASLEQDYDKNTLIKKSDIFTQRVNVPKPQVEHIDTASEALAVCIAEKGYIDFDYMSNLTDIDKASLEESLRNNGEIYPIPMNTENNEYTYQTASEYLSGDIYAKLDTAESYAAVDNIYSANVTALKAALPTPLKAGDIDVNLGATWIAPEYYEQFMYKLFETPLFNRSDGIFKDSKISVEYSEYSGKWFISHKSADKSVTVTKTYGACGYSGYQILEAALNLSEPKVYKDKLDEYGRIMFDKNNKPIRVIDVPATQVVQQKANKIRREFKNWLFSDPVRRSDIVDTYNRTFNCIKPREYDGSHLTFPGMNSNIELHEHQKNAIAHAIYGGNTLFAHSVGAGKTFEMIATAMECKRLGLCHKSLFAVPNHLTEQVGNDFIKLYPNANILVATKDDFKAENRKRLMSKIATGNYDAVIIGHTQLKMLPLSPERQENIFKEQIDNIVAGIVELKYQEGNSFKVKDMERTKRSLEQQLEKLQSSKKDNTVYFEELGIDKLFVDEAHEFKNLFCTTKLQNVSGISSRASQRATELFAKCRYLDEKTGGKGVVFATGTPLSNSVTELHTMMRYLNYDFLASHNNMQNFDNWVSTFGVQKKEYELAPAGNKFKERTRIAEYANLPELMSMFKTIADVRTADTLNLKVPDCELHIVDVEPTELQTELVEELSDRADEVNNGSVDPSQDNMLKITGDGRKLGLDPRLINPSFEDDPGTKLNVCVNNVFDIYEKTSDKKLTQIVFCDLGVPSKNSSADGNKDDDTKSVAELDSLEESGKFCVYDDIRDKLIAKGVSADEIAYIHNAKSETQKSELFAKVRSGEVRILLGSTGKMGTGTNVQDRIIALHDLDVPWRPSDLEQRRGRMVRQGNINDKVHLYRYVTKGTFDAYSYQLLEKKQKFISQIMTSKEPGRKCADVDQAALTYSEIKALCTGDERIREKLTLENRVKELQALKSEYNSTRYELEDKVNAYPEERKKLLLDIGNISKDMETVKNIPFDVKTESYRVGITIGKDAYSLLDDESRKVAAKALTNAVAQVKGDANKNKRIAIGGLGNFGVEVINDGYFLDKITATLRGNYTYSVELGVSSIINLKKIENLLFKVENVLNDKKSELNKLDIDYKTAQNMLHKPFEFEDELNNSTKRLDELTTALNIDMSEHKVDKPKKTHYFGKDFILGKNKSSKQIQNNEVMKSEPKRSEQEL
nr:LPD25 domain-containing protein [uncultured Ruminococcus sp.]